MAAGGGEMAMSPISMAACSTPRTLISPRHALTTPRFSAAVAAATATAAATVTAAPGAVGGRSMRSFSAGLDPYSTGSVSWWGELDLSPPPKLDYPDGILKWRWGNFFFMLQVYFSSYISIRRMKNLTCKNVFI